MNKEINYIIKGFLLFLLIPLGAFTTNKIGTIQQVRKISGTITDYEMAMSTNIVGKASKGKMLFIDKCGACHNVFKDGTGPALIAFQERGPWSEKENLYAWIKNPSAFMKRNVYAKELKERYGSVMTAFPDLSNEEIDAIVDYINQSGSVRNLPIAKNDYFTLHFHLPV